MKKRTIHFWKIFGTGRTFMVMEELLPLLLFGMPTTLRYLPSDEVLGAIESGVDFEKTHSRNQQCCTHEEIDAVFRTLPDEMEDGTRDRSRS